MKNLFQQGAVEEVVLAFALAAVDGGADTAKPRCYTLPNLLELELSDRLESQATNQGHGGASSAAAGFLGRRLWEISAECVATRLIEATVSASATHSIPFAAE